MTTIIRNISMFSNANSVEEAREMITSYVENYIGHVVSDLAEAREWFSDMMDEDQDVKWGECQTARFTLDNDEAEVHVRITEIYFDSASVDYCYDVCVEEC